MIKYIDKLILPDKYILIDPSGKKFNNIFDWVRYKTRRPKDKHFKYKYKTKLPYLWIINLDTSRYLNIDAKNGSIEHTIIHLSKNIDRAMLFFASDFSKIVFEKFINDDGDTHYLDFDLYYGLYTLDITKAYYTVYKDFFKSKSNIPLRISSSLSMKYNKAFRTDFSYSYQCSYYTITENGYLSFGDANQNTMGEIPVYCLKEYAKRRPSSCKNLYRISYTKNGTNFLSELYEAYSEEDALNRFKKDFSNIPEKFIFKRILSDGQWF